ncbi:MAG: L,D-transpeptidase family protein, partial [Deltaproteobacteria bacterium]|nr:L,D-transpeptidase family protein [Deltaproteobacteria bacterium]
MEQRAFRINYRSRLMLAALFAMLGAGFWASGVVADDRSSDTSAAAPQNALGQSLSQQEQNELARLIAMANLADLRWPHFIEYRAQVSTFYEAGAYSLAWIGNNQPTPQALALIQLFKAAAEKGLNPDDYDGPRWDDRIARMRASSPDDLMHFDLALTVCAMRYVSALHIGRVNPQHFKFGLDIGPKRYDLTEFLRNEVIYSHDVKAAVASVEPRYAGYDRLKAALGVYMKLAAEGDGEAVPVPAKTVRPGDSYAGMAQLVARLTQLGDAGPDVSNQFAEEASVYQGAVVNAVKHFQRRHGLKPDGSISKDTVAALNTPLRVRVQQIQFALERYRWISDSFPQAPIVVNIPEFRLRTMIRQPGAVPLDMAVVVGKAYQHQTPVFADYMRYVIFRPYWEVPPSITRAELIPKIRRNPNYLVAHNYIVVDGVGDTIGGGAVVGGLLSGAYRIRQKPGPKNSLGLVKFMFPNSYNVYMHGTPATQLFARSR